MNIYPSIHVPACQLLCWSVKKYLKKKLPLFFYHVSCFFRRLHFLTFLCFSSPPFLYNISFNSFIKLIFLLLVSFFVFLSSSVLSWSISDILIFYQTWRWVLQLRSLRSTGLSSLHDQINVIKAYRHTLWSSKVCSSYASGTWTASAPSLLTWQHTLHTVCMLIAFELRRLLALFYAIFREFLTVFFNTSKWRQL